MFSAYNRRHTQTAGNHKGEGAEIETPKATRGRNGEGVSSSPAENEFWSI